MLEQILIIIFFILIIKAVSWLVDRTSHSKPKKITPEETENTEIRKFFWVVEDNLQSYSLNCEVKINLANVEEAKAALLTTEQPSKIKFSCEDDYFNISRIEILHEKFGLDSQEIRQIADYLRETADKNFMSSYQFANLILSFVHEQNIKYSYDEDSTSYIEYFRFPIETIYDTTGDCDCKAILACSLFKKLGYRVAFALMPGHAALAISTESAPFFGNFEMNGTSWFYCESTGDDWKPGQIPSNIYTNQVILREI